jgi:hypothetical protein
MSEPQSFARVILKILSGVQSGAEVSLNPGEYTIGSGSADDIQLIDVSLKPGQAKLRINPGKIEVAGGTGGVAVGDDIKLPAESEWQQVEPLDVITVGMIRVVLGPPNANWTTLLEDAPQTYQKKETPKKKFSYFGVGLPLAFNLKGRLNQLAVPAGVLLAVIFICVWYFAFGGKENSTPRLTQGEASRVAREALDQFSFGRPISLKREVDGTIYATGFVKDAFERRALISAVEKSGAQVYFRLGVLDSIKNEIDGFIKSDKAPVTYTLSPKGDLVLEGLILSDDDAQKFVGRIKEAVVGLNRVESRIRTARSLLDDIQKLSRTAQIDPYVLLRIDGSLIEATGLLPTEKIDAWIGFLTAYSRRFSKDIALRSFVQLQKPGGVGAPGMPVVIGAANGGKILDRDQLLNNRYKTDDLFASAQISQEFAVPPKLSSAVPPIHDELFPTNDQFNALRLTEQANKLIKTWQSEAALSDESTKSLETEFALLINRRAAIDGSSADRDKYISLLPDTQGPGTPCRLGSKLTVENLPTAIFWLDLLSVSTTYSLVTFAPDDQGFILEAALDPQLAIKCFERIKGPAKITSFYLTEAPRNPDFIRYLLRDYHPFALDISGASINGLRYVQTRSGLKMREGETPDGSSRLALVGELGSIIRQKNGYSPVIYAQQLNWLSQK